MNEFKQWIHGIAELLAGPSQKYQDLEELYDDRTKEWRRYIDRSNRFEEELISIGSTSIEQLKQENEELKGKLSSAMESLAQYKELFLNNKIVFEARNK